jgi:hypothetical protein
MVWQVCVHREIAQCNGGWRMKISLRTTAIVAAAFIGVSINVGTASAQVGTVQCDFKTWVRTWLGDKLDARSLKDGLANTICHFSTDKDYCKVSPNFKTLVMRQSNNYQSTLANEVLLSQGAGYATCILCLKRDLYQTVAKRMDSIQSMCKNIGDLVANRQNLKYIYDNNMNCGFKLSQAALVDENFDDAYWNIGSNSIRFWLSSRIIPDLQLGLSDEILSSEMNNVGLLLQPFVSKYPPGSQDQGALEQAFNGITCTSIDLPPCTRPQYQCPP